MCSFCTHQRESVTVVQVMVLLNYYFCLAISGQKHCSSLLWLERLCQSTLGAVLMKTHVNAAHHEGAMSVPLMASPPCAVDNVQHACRQCL